MEDFSTRCLPGLAVKPMGEGAQALDAPELSAPSRAGLGIQSRRWDCWHHCCGEPQGNHREFYKERVMQKILGRKRPELGPWTWEVSLAKP